MLLWNNYQVLCCCDFDGIFWFLCKCHTVLLKCYCSILNSILQAFTGLFFNTIGSFNTIVLGPYNIVILKKNALFFIYTVQLEWYFSRYLLEQIVFFVSVLYIIFIPPTKLRKQYLRGSTSQSFHFICAWTKNGSLNIRLFQSLKNLYPSKWSAKVLPMWV